MRIIVDGPDGTGKTTLIKLYEEKGYKCLYHGTKASAFDIENDYKIIIDYIKKNPNENIVIDRLFHSQYIYSSIFGDVIVSKESMKEISSYFDMAIFALPYSKEQYIAHFFELEKQRDEMYKGEQMFKVYDKYETVYKRKDEIMKDIDSNLIFLRYDMFLNWRK